MRQVRDLLGLLLLLLAGVPGCALFSDPEIKPPRPPEEFRPPPADDPRYSKPIEYPRDAMDQDPLRQKNKGGMPPMTGAPGSMPGQRLGAGGRPTGF